ncbi:hypothetical protein PTKIN_Ptkin08bG0067100 [Pterospermum kingtungense]
MALRWVALHLFPTTALFTLFCRFILTGCYDGLGRVWKGSGWCTHILEGHSGAISSVSIINSKGDGSATVATASKDRTLRLWKFDAEDSSDHPARIRAFKILHGHNVPVQSVVAKTSGDMVCSGSWDCTINLWQTDDSNTDGDVVSIKKRKVNNKAKESQSEIEAVSTPVGHTQCVSCVVWPQNETVYSTSWDRFVRRWDVETGKDLADILCGKVLNCIDVGGEGLALIAAGGSDPILRIWDPRKPGTSAPVFQFSSHSSWISACKWHNTSSFHLLSSSYDGKLMLWDLRTAVSYSLSFHYLPMCYGPNKKQHFFSGYCSHKCFFVWQWPLAIMDKHKEKVWCYSLFYVLVFKLTY